MAIPANAALPSVDVSVLEFTVEHLTLLEVNIYTGSGELDHSDR